MPKLTIVITDPNRRELDHRLGLIAENLVTGAASGTLEWKIEDH